ncbi:Hypothetical predicted protein, partial [Pelobates cultripes]
TKSFHKSQDNLLVPGNTSSIMEHKSCNIPHCDTCQMETNKISYSTSKHKKSASFSLSSSWHGQFPKNEKQKIHKSVSEK